MKKIEEKWSDALRSMKTGEIAEFPVKSISTVNSTISRLRLEMCVEGADWKRIGDIDKRKGLFRVKRIA